MNFKKLQAMQAKLDEAILKEKAPMTAEERFNKTLVALSVEIAEVANTVEHFKFWKDNKGKVDSKRFVDDWDYEGKQVIGYYDFKNGATHQISFEQAHKLTLIEECSDALHFILSLANQSNYDIEYGWEVSVMANLSDSVEEMYLDIQWLIHESKTSEFLNRNIVEFFFGYINQLGVTAQELEQAYYDKNKVNYERLENGY